MLGVAHTLIHGARLFDGATIREESWIIFGDAIECVGMGVPPESLDAGRVEIVDARGRLVSHTLFETHVHGGGGFAAEEGLESMRAVLRFHRGHGVGPSFLSIASLPRRRMMGLILQAAVLRAEDPRFLGLHIEGPFLAPTHRGAHKESFLRGATDGEIAEIVATANGTVRSMTVAPELMTETQVLMLLDAGIQPCFGHSGASFEEARSHFELGGRVVTHAFNAMNPIHHREPGPVLAAIDNEDVWLELIADGVHVHRRSAGLLPNDRVILVTDAMAAAGQPDGKYRLGDTNVIVKGQISRTNNGGLGGSVLTLNKAVERYANWTGSLLEAMLAATTNPARAYGLESATRLAPGDATDLVMWSEKMEPDRMWSVAPDNSVADESY